MRVCAQVYYEVGVSGVGEPAREGRALGHTSLLLCDH